MPYLVGFIILVLYAQGLTVFGLGLSWGEIALQYLYAIPAILAAVYVYFCQAFKVPK